MEIFAASYVLPIASPSISGGAFAVDGGRIVDIGPLVKLKAMYGAPVSEFPGCAILPGLVNAHTHLELTHFPSWKLRKGIDYSPRTYIDWIIQVIKIKRSLTPQERELSVKEGCRISLESGTTAVGDILTDFSLLPLYARLPLSGRLFFEALGHDPVRCADLIRKMQGCLDDFPGGDLLPGISPHAPHTVSDTLFQELAHLAGQRQVPLMVHLSESQEEETFCFDSTGAIAEIFYPFVDWQGHIPAPGHCTATEHLQKLGILGPSTVAVHCVHVTPSDAHILKRQGVKAVLCPRSNDKLNVGMPPAALLKKAGIPLALGTDSLASNDSLSMLDELRFALAAFPDIFSPEELLEMATRGGAEALSLNAQGSLDTGKKADFIVVKAEGDKNGIHRNIIENGELLEVFIGGKMINTML